MAGVTNYCSKCGFTIFDEQTIRMLCDKCATEEDEELFEYPPEDPRGLIEYLRSVAEAGVDLRDFTLDDDLSEGDEFSEISEPWFCNHANEVPSRCSCGPDCYCKSHTCKPKQARKLKKKKAKKPTDTSFLRKFDNLDLENNGTGD